MMGKKLLGVVLSANLLVGSFLGTPFTASQSVNHSQSTAINSLEQISDESVDLAIANDEKIISMLKKNGKIPKNASQATSEKLLKVYLKSLEKNNTSNKNITIDGAKKQLQANGLVKPSTKKKVKNAETQAWDGKVMKDNVLVLLIQFADFTHNKMTPEECDFLYQDFNTQHYQDMIFGQNGYKGPDGQQLMSFRQFYNEQSGGSFDVNGTVLGWYTSANAAAYYGADKGTNHNVKVRDLVKEALVAASKDMDLSKYDMEDTYDLDGDGDLNEPDGIIDHLMLVHAGAGQEAGGGSLGTDSIWSHSSKVYAVQDGQAVPWPIPGTTSTTPYWGGSLTAFPYTIMPEDGAAPVFCHEFGHDLGLPDEYDTQYTGVGEPVEYWSMMSSGSWAGKIGGTEPVGFSPWGKSYFQNRYGGNWIHGTEVNLSDLNTKGLSFTLDQASQKGPNQDVVKVNLPDKETVTLTPFGTNCYFSGSADDINNNNMSVNLDLTNNKAATLKFKAWYDIEQDWDYGSVQVREGDGAWTSVAGNITTTTNPNEQNPGNGITGKSAGWVDAEFNLDAYAGKKIEVKINYWTDGAATMPGLYVDNITIAADGAVIVSDDAEAATSKFALNGFTRNNGKKYTKQYYLLEWRNATGADSGLANIRRGASLMSYASGLVVWYADELYTDNWTGPVENGGHPGHGFISVLDANQTLLKWSDGSIATTRYQLHDAAFSLRANQAMNLVYPTRTLTDNVTGAKPIFNDGNSFFTNELPDAGVLIQKLGLKVYVTSQSFDNSVGKITIKK